MAPLHWGLGHATRCIPIIRSLLKNNYHVLLASDGAALLFLQKEFPNLESITLPGYNITYTKKGKWLKWKLLRKLPHIKKTLQAEKKLIEKLVNEHRIDGIISDNRLGVYSNKIPSVFITHQLNVLSGSTSMVSSKMHQNIIANYQECWVPDVSGPINLSGKLGHLPHSTLPIKYIGPLSRMKPQTLPIMYDVLCLISGPEPQRSILEEKLKNVFTNSKKKVALVQGVIEDQPSKRTHQNITIFNYLETQGLEKLINQSQLVVSRSGYTTLMDLAVLQKPAFFIPTPGQYEQEYLAKRLKEQGSVPSCKQEKFTELKLQKVGVYTGLKKFVSQEEYGHLFGLFERE